MKSVAPYLIVAYRRNDNVVRLLEILARNMVDKVYLAIDGPRNADDKKSQDELLTLIAESQEIKKTALVVWQRLENLGPAVSVLTALEWFFSHEDRGVILEDDLLIDGNSIHFFDEALRSFDSDARVGLISGSNYFGEIGVTAELPFSEYPLTWGWATWRSRWKLLRQPFFEDKSISLSGCSFVEKAFWKTGIERCMDQSQDAWDIPFAAEFKSLELKAVIPNKNVITNIGNDEFAGNTFSDQWPLNTPITGEFSEGCNLGLSDDLDLTKKIVDGIYRISAKSLFTRPLRWLQHRSRVKLQDSGDLHKKLQKIQIPI